MPEFIDPVFRENKPKRSFSVIENERFGLVFAKIVSINSGTGLLCSHLHRIFVLSIPCERDSILFKADAYI